MKYYAVTGRIPDREDMTYLFDAESPKQAAKKFADAIWNDDGDPEERDRRLISWGTDVFIVTIIESDTPLREVS